MLTTGVMTVENVHRGYWSDLVKSAPGCTRVLIEGTEMMVDSARLLIDVLYNSDQHCTVYRGTSAIITPGPL